jgi:hypothetical protein
MYKEKQTISPSHVGGRALATYQSGVAACQ